MLTYSRAAPFESVDPQQTFDRISDEVLRPVFSTLLIHSYLERPYKLEPDLLSTAVLPVEAVQMYKGRIGVNPVGTRPFSLQGPVDRNSMLHFVKNPSYYRNYLIALRKECAHAQCPCLRERGL